jgi:hypothetical protein
VIEQVTIHHVHQEGEGWRFTIMSGLGQETRALFIGSYSYKNLRECGEAAIGTLELIRQGEGKKGS